MSRSPISRPPRDPMQIPAWLIAMPALMLLILVAYPVAMLLAQSLWPNIFGARFNDFGAAYARLIETPELVRLISGSLLWAGCTTVLALILGAPAGWLLARTDLRCRAIARIALLVPLMTPPYVLALAYILLMQRGGLADSVFGELPQWGRSLFFSFWGITFVMAISSVGYVALAVESALHGIPTRLERAAESLGASRARVMRTVMLPLLLPALANAALIVFLDAISNFGVPAVLGPRSGVLLLPAEIYYRVTSWPVDLPLATALSSILMLIAAVGLLANRAIASRSISGSSRQASAQDRQALGPLGQTLAWSYFLLLFACATLAPLAAVLVTSTQGDWTDGKRSFTLEHYTGLFSSGSRGFSALLTSLWLSVVAATVCLVLGGLIAYLNSRARGRLVAALDATATLPRVMPKIVVAVGLILAWNAPWVQVRIYGTVWILLIAYIALYVSDALRLSDAGARQIPQRLELAAQSLGASRWRTIRTVTLPLLRPSLIAAWATTFVVCLRDLVASVMLLPPGVDTVGSFIFSQFEQGDIASAMAMAVVSTLLGIAVLLVVRTRR